MTTINLTCDEELTFSQFLNKCENHNNNKITIGTYIKNSNIFNNNITEDEYNNLKKKYNIINTEVVTLNIRSKISNTEKKEITEEVTFKDNDFRYVNKKMYYINDIKNWVDIKNYNFQCINSDITSIDKNEYQNKDKSINMIKEQIDIGNKDVYVYLIKDVLNNNTCYGCDIYVLKSNDIINIKKTIYTILKVMKNINNVLSESVKKMVINKYNKITKQDKFKMIGKQPHSIKLEKLDKDMKYYFSYKYDGMRTLIFVDDLGDCYLIDKLSVSKIETQFYDIFKNTIFDSEYYNDKLYIFDILYYKGNKIEQNIGFEKKMYIVNELLSINKCNIKNELAVLPYYFYENIYDGMTTMINNIDNNKHDGIVLTPDNDNSIKLKWKPRELNTIDFKIQIKTNNLAHLYCYNGENRNTLLEYKKNGFDIVSKITDENVIKRLNNNVVYECTFNFNNKKFEVLKERKDKFRGNFISVAIDNLENILYPFNIEVLKANVIDFHAKRFNNWIKREYLTNYCINKNLLDINIDNSNDIQKWLDTPVKNVEMITNNEEFIGIIYNKLNKIQKNLMYKKNDTVTFKKHNVYIDGIESNEIDIVTIFGCNQEIIENFDKLLISLQGKIVILQCDLTCINMIKLDAYHDKIELLEKTVFADLYKRWSDIHGNYLEEDEIPNLENMTMYVYKII